MSTLIYTVSFLKENRRKKYFALQIANELVRREPAWANKKHKSSAEMNRPPVERQIQSEIGSSKAGLHAHGVRWTDETPTRYYFAGVNATPCLEAGKLQKNDPAVGLIGRQTTRSSAARKAWSTRRTRERTHPESQTESDTVVAEKDLYEPLWRWLRRLPRKIYAMRIDETRTNSNFRKENHWRFPDLVGLEPLSKNWHHTTRRLAKEISASKMRLWSFEVKTHIGRSNARESYFQAVSNSSWANVGYLVAQECEEENAMEEIRLLNEVHGIGFIKLNPEDPDQSRILITARPRRDLDWNAIDRLCEHSPDYRDFVAKLLQFIASDQVPEFPSVTK